MDNTWRHSDNKNTMTLKGKFTETKNTKFKVIIIIPIKNQNTHLQPKPKKKENQADCRWRWTVVGSARWDDDFWSDPNKYNGFQTYKNMKNRTSWLKDQTRNAGIWSAVILLMFLNHSGKWLRQAQHTTLIRPAGSLMRDSDVSHRCSCSFEQCGYHWHTDPLDWDI